MVESHALALWTWAGQRLVGVLALFFAVATFAQTLQTQPAPSPRNTSTSPIAITGPASVAVGAPIIQLSKQRTLVLDERVNRIKLEGLSEYWLDNDTTTTIQAVAARANAGVDLFKPSSATDTHHAHGKVLWMRFEAQVTDPRSRWLLEVDSPLMDDVQLFWQTSGDQWLVLKAGDKVPRINWPLRTRVPTFELIADPLQTKQAITYYLRVENARAPISLPMSLYRDTQLVSDELLRTLLIGMMLGWVCLVLGAGIVMAVTQRDAAFAAYAGYTLSLSMYMMASIGVSAMYLWPHSVVLADRMNFVTAGITAAIGPWFVSIILRPVYRRNLLAFITAVMATIVLVITGFEAFSPSLMSYQLLNLGSLLAIVVVYLLVASAWQRGEPITRWIALCFAPVALAALPLIMRNLGLIPNSWITQYSMLIATTIEIPSLLYALTLRNSLRRESRARALGLPKHDAFTGLPNMRSFLENLHGSITRAQRFEHRYGLILVDLSNYDWFVKEHGQNMANNALVLGSTRLQEVGRDVDCLCRLDDNQFVMLVEGQCTAGQISKIAARIAAIGLKPSEALPVGSSLKFHITCALLPTEESDQQGDDANAQLGWLLAQAEHLEKDQRKTIRTIGF
jgi:two-component system, sensor histidine kinase LadS